MLSGRPATMRIRATRPPFEGQKNAGLPPTFRSSSTRNSRTSAVAEYGTAGVRTGTTAGVRAAEQTETSWPGVQRVSRAQIQVRAIPPLPERLVARTDRHCHCRTGATDSGRPARPASRFPSTASTNPVMLLPTSSSARTMSPTWSSA